MNLNNLPKRQVKDRVSATEVQAVLKEIRDVAPDKHRVAVAIYGSRAAGYARKDSDYDVLLVLKNYPQPARYKYIEGSVNVSVLIVDGAALEKDAAKASLGEFVVGRLLNIYQSIDEGDFLRQIEVTYKRRVMMELLAEVVASYTDFAPELIIPLEYFLFEKLRKRAAVYPPALYSYVKTYTGALRDENVRFSVEGFRSAAEEIGAEKLITLEDGLVRLMEHSIRSGQLTKLSQLVTDTARGLTQYAVHGYAGRVALSVVGKEALSKIRRTREAGELPAELKNPKSLWRIEEGLLLVDEEEWRHSILESLGYDVKTRVRSRHLGEVYNVTKEYVVSDGSREVCFAVKNFRDIRSVKWALLNIWTITAKRFNMSPLARMHREYRASMDLRRNGLVTPEVMAVVLNERILVTRFVEGTNLGQIASEIVRGRSDDTTPVTLYGEVLGRVHGFGYALGDTKASNTIYSGRGVCLTDLEQASKEGDKAWDIAEFIYFSCKLTPNAPACRMLSRAFLQGYLRYGDRKTVEAALNIKYLTPFQPFLVPNTSAAVRDEIRRTLRQVNET